MKRREFIGLVGGAAVWPIAAAQAQQPTVPVIGFLSPRSPDESAPFVAAFRRGLEEAGLIEGRNVALEFRWALGQYAELPRLAEELVQAKINVLVTVGGEPAALAAKAATTTVPIVGLFVGDPVESGWLQVSTNRAGT